MTDFRAKLRAKAIFIFYGVLFVSIFLAVGGWFYLDLLTGNVNKFEDVTTNSKLWGGYAPGQVYTLTAPVLTDGDRLFSATSLRDYSSKDASLPANIEEYKSRPSSWPKLKLVAAGTRIRITHFKLYESFEYSDLSVYADILNGDSQAKDLLIIGLSRRPASDVTLWEPDPAVLESGTK